MQDLFLTETAFHADVILPASAFAEKIGTFTNTDRRVQLARPGDRRRPGEARQDWWIIQEIAQRMGLRVELSRARATCSPRWRHVMPSLAQHHLGAAGARGRRDLSGATRRTSRATRSSSPQASRPRAAAAKIVPANVLPPDELPDDAYPMVLSTGRVLEHWHTGSMTRRAGVLDAIEPEAVAFMSPQDLRRRGIAPGEFVRLETRRGAIEVQVARRTRRAARTWCSCRSATPRRRRTC